MGTGYKDLIVWQKAKELAVEIYRCTEQFPSVEMYGLTAQMRRCAVSIPSNIAEGSKRGTEKDFRHFLSIALGSGAELETQIEISKSLSFAKNIPFGTAESLLDECMKMLTRMIRPKD